MLGYSKILCALDFDEHAMSTLRVAGALAKESNATLDILHIARVPARDMDVPLPFDADPIWEKEAREEIEKLIQRSSIGDLKYDVRIVSGLPALDIARAAAELAVDLIVIATHGRSGFAHLILGSVAEHVIREAVCPVLILRPPKQTAKTTNPAN